MYNSSAMTTALRAMTSIGLSIWMSALACLVGCGQTLASSRTVHRANSVQIELTEMPSCHHSHSPTPSNQKKQDSSSTVSCCLPDAISQKTAADLNINVTYALISSVAIDVEDQPYALAENPFQAGLHGGRQTILQTHLLRI
jgi:curli biogenesis system outer membrane secretion channel CsgG